MSDLLNSAVEALNAKLESGFDSTAKFELTGVGALILDADGVRIGDDEAEVTLTADPDVFEEILTGELNPTSAFMGGKLSIDGDMGVAMKLASLLA